MITKNKIINLIFILLISPVCLGSVIDNKKLIHIYKNVLGHEIKVFYSKEDKEYRVSSGHTHNMSNDCKSNSYILCFHTNFLTIALPNNLYKHMSWEEQPVIYKVSNIVDNYTLMGMNLGRVYVIKATRRHFLNNEHRKPQEYHLIYSIDKGLLAFQAPQSGLNGEFYLKINKSEQD